MDRSTSGISAGENDGRFFHSTDEVGVAADPLGWDPREGFGKLFPHVSLPTQLVDRVSLGNASLPHNRLFWGDNLHVMRQLPSGSIDLIYADPPFFSGRKYNMAFGDRGEIKSFSDTWDEGMSGYLIWLNARLYEMKRLLKETGAIFLHCDWHASHYIKVEMDKIFGCENFVNEIIWSYKSGGGSKRHFGKKHDTLLFYARDIGSYRFFPDALRVPYDAVIAKSRQDLFNERGKVSPDVWSIPRPPNHSKEWMGYPTQKPERLLERVIESVTEEGDVVADFFCGGGTTPAVAQRLGRRWVACDQSRVAVAMTAHRLGKPPAGGAPVPDFTVEYWGVYERTRLSETAPEEFRSFILYAFGVKSDESHPGIHGWREDIPLSVGSPDLGAPVTARDVRAFADSLYGIGGSGDRRDGIMLAWSFDDDAIEEARRLQRPSRDGGATHIELIPLDSPRFREQFTGLSGEHSDYESFLTFAGSPRVAVTWERLGPQKYIFDLTGTSPGQPEARIISVQWDFDYRGDFTYTDGYSFVIGAKGEPILRLEYEFPKKGPVGVACKMQDDCGGYGVWSRELLVE